MSEEKTSNVKGEKNGAKSAAPNSGKEEGKKPRFGGKRRRRPARQPKEFEESIIQIDRVTRVTKGGRQLRFRVSIVIGDKKGRVGFGIGKSGEVMTGVQKAIAAAKRNLVTVPIFEDSIPHASTVKFKATKVTLFPAPEGKGVIAGSSVRKILELSGVKNVLSKLHGSRNRLNAAYATMEALKALENSAPRKSKKAIAEAEAVVAEKPAVKKAPVAKKIPKKFAPKKKVAKAVEKKAPVAKSGKKDNLTKVEGIGPKIAEHLNNAGINTFAELAGTKVEAIQEVLNNAGPRYKIHNPATWSKQADLAANGKWDELKKWQDELDGGK